MCGDTSKIVALLLQDAASLRKLGFKIHARESIKQARFFRVNFK
jgi:hypothetical protein